MSADKKIPGGFRLIRKSKNAVKSSSMPSLSRIRVQKTINKIPERPSLFVFTLYVIYKNLYILGCTLLRRKRAFFRRFKLFVSKIRGSSLAGIYRLSHFSRRFWLDFTTRVKAPFLRIGNVYREQRPVMESKRKQGKMPVESYMQVAEAVVRLFARILATILNYTVPVLVGLVVILFVNGFIGQSFGLEVIYEGEPIGYIKSESDFDAAVRDVKSRTIYGGSSYTTSVPNFELVACVDPQSANDLLLLYNGLLSRVGFKLVETPEFTSTTELANSIIKASGKEIEEAYGFYIDGRLYGAVRDKDIVLDTLESMQKHSASGKPDERLSFDRSITLDGGLYPTVSIVDESVIIDVITSYETIDRIYVVQENDTPSGIAQSQGIPYVVLKEINPGIEDDLKPGQEIKTAVARPFLSVKSTYTDVYTEDVPFETVENENAIYAKSFREVTQEGANGLREVTARVSTVNGMEVGREEISSVELRAPVEEKVTVGVETVYRAPAPAQTPQAGDSGTSGTQGQQPNIQPSQALNQAGFIWPISSSHISCYLGGYPGHTGIDIDGPVGTPIYASASGTVTIAKRTYYGYGIYAKIDHGNGFETLYAHCSDIYVSVGDYVQQGQVIGLRGRTGNVSGPHLHFEIIKNKSIQNPLNYVSPP